MNGSDPGQIMFQLQKIIVLKLYYVVPPLRLEYADMVLTKALPKNRKWNYITTGDKKMHLFKFKTVKSVKPQEWPLKRHPEIFRYIKRLIQLRNQKSTKIKQENRLFLLLNPFTREKMTRTGLTTYLNSIFERNISSTMLRRIYLSEHFKVKRGESVADRKSVLSIMGQKHLSMQDRYRKIIR